MSGKIRSAIARLQAWFDRLFRHRWLRCTLLLLALPTLLLAGFALYGLWLFTRNVPVTYADPAEHFKYGSTRGEMASGLPYWIWQVLPQVCGQHLPDPRRGYASLGLIYEDGRDLPIGMSKRNYQGVDRTFLNCSVCHTSTWRETPGAEPTIVLGMPGNRFRVWDLQRFLFACAKDPKFSTEFVVPAIDRAMRERGERLGLLDRYAIYPVAIALMRERLLMLAGRFEPLMQYPEWGPGRVDTFNAAKVIFNFPMAALPEHEKNAPSDFPSIWLQRPREGMQLHWDGNNTSVEERNKSAAFGTGTMPSTIDVAAIARIEDWLLTLEPPPYPFPIDQAQAARGKTVYGEYCADCHGAGGRDFSGAHVGKVTPLAGIGTDRRRLDSYSRDLAVNQSTLYAGYPWRFTHFRKTDGYANMPLDGLWLRAPYLHNGSVPTLRDLLEPASGRPRSFWRGDDVYDRHKVGFVSDIDERDGVRLFLFDTSVPGNSNAGHEGADYGTDLSDEDKDALVTFLKTF
ncbi:MAG TPA: c-type cytochrome [Luteimonas sp.]|nr:c-type cytochrome [Luteimonas sp.]HRO26478.1 c-type cytochrome [Luteimonas sp.]HRP71700.1 c-type cytochrome [Luteimonas sp.]